MTVSGGQSFSRRLFAGYQAVVAGFYLGSLGANPLLFGARALLAVSLFLVPLLFPF